MYIIPSVDIKDGKCVKLVQGKIGSGRIISDDPVSVAIGWKKEGAKLLHVVDLDGAFTGERKNWVVITQILNEIGLPVEVGGGIRSFDDVLQTLNAGARWVIIGTIAVEQPAFLSELFSYVDPSQVILAIDTKGGKVVSRGWTVEGSESPTKLVEKYQKVSPSAFLYTNVEVEGKQAGIDLQTVKKLVSLTKVPIIYSGGISDLQDLVNLAQAGVAGAIVGSAFYAGKFSLKEAELVVEKAVN